MPEYPEEYRVAMNSLLNLYEKYQNLAFAVLRREVVSTAVDTFFMQHGFKDMLAGFWDTVSTTENDTISAIIPDKLTAFPVQVLSALTSESYDEIQHTYGLLKEVANEIGAVGKQMPPDVQSMLTLAEAVKSGEQLKTGILLSQSDITEYDTERAELVINNTPISFRDMAQCDYINKAMFQYPVRTPVSWDEINDQINRSGDGFENRTGFFAAMYRLNNHIKNRIGTNDNFYTRGDGMITRQFGADVIN